MKKVLLIAIGISLGMITESKAQRIPSTYAADNFAKVFNEKPDRLHFKVNYKAYHYPEIGFMHAGIKGYRAVVPQKIIRDGLLTQKMQLPHRVRILPLYSAASFGLSTNENYSEQLDVCSCHLPGVKLYQCSSNKVNNKNLQPANSTNKKLADYASDEDGGLNINLTGTTSLNVDLGYSKLSTDSVDNLVSNLDNDTNDGLGISIGFQFGIGK